MIIDAPYSVTDQLLDQYKVRNINQELYVFQEAGVAPLPPPPPPPPQIAIGFVLPFICWPWYYFWEEGLSSLVPRPSLDLPAFNVAVCVHEARGCLCSPPPPPPSRANIGILDGCSFFAYMYILFARVCRLTSWFMETHQSRLMW